MVVGHFAVGFAAKRVAPCVSLGTLQLASVLPDLLVCGLLLAGVEHIRISPGITAYSYLDAYDIAISHSLMMDLIWAGLFAAAYFRRSRDSRGAWVLFAAVLSHWVLDVVSHRPDMPLAPGVHRSVGLGLWNSLPATFAIEGALWLFGIVVYARATRPTNRLGTYALWTVVSVLTLAWIAFPFRPAPPSPLASVIRAATFDLAVLVWAYWVDRYRAFRALRDWSLFRATVQHRNTA
jgi:membrane-bound metal-dependent hydrolase YbcI (DUF457 family)